MYEQIIQFIRKSFNQMEGLIPLHEPIFNGNEKKYLEECISTTYVSSVGKFVDRFELMVSEYTGSKKSVACVNGTNALHLALKLVGVEQGDEVITQPLTFIATVNAIMYCNAHPVFIDVDMDTMGLSPNKMEEWLQMNAEIKKGGCFNKATRRRIKACVPMHTFGHPVKLDELVGVCLKYKIELVEDAAESFGSFYKERHTGTFGKIGVLSFNGNKIITTGGGGMLLFDDEELGSKAKHLTTQAKIPHPWEFVHDNIGYNYRLPNINAALGCAQMEQLSTFLDNKRQLANEYEHFFKNLTSSQQSYRMRGISFFLEPEDSRSNYWLNTLILNNLTSRNSFLEYSNGQGVMTRPTWRLMNKLPIFSNSQCGDLSNALWLEERAVNLPSSVRLLK
jgi:perosamine synthetase